MNQLVPSARFPRVSGLTLVCRYEEDEAKTYLVKLDLVFNCQNFNLQLEISYSCSSSTMCQAKDVVLFGHDNLRYI